MIRAGQMIFANSLLKYLTYPNVFSFNKMKE